MKLGNRYKELVKQGQDYGIYQTNNKDIGEEDVIHESIDLKWEDATSVYVEDKKRIMPKGLLLLIDGIKDYYNDWQKHPEYERIK